MTSICFYFQVHQPYRMRPYQVLDIGTDTPYFNDAANREICKKVAEKCYLPTNALMLELLKKDPDFRIAYSISGVALEQFEEYAPEVLASFKKLAATGQVEFLAETYYHSLAAIYDVDEFKSQVELHKKALKRHFGITPTAFRNTELIYSDAIAAMVEHMGFKVMLTEGADHILGWRSPNFVYQPAGCTKMKLLLKNYKLSDDIAFRFSDRTWKDYPLTTDKFTHWVHQLAGQADTVNFFMDYETFGEHQWSDTGIFDFLRTLPANLKKHPEFTFATPSTVAAKYPVKAELSIPNPISWADQERDLSAWVGNPMQDGAIAWVYKLGEQIKATKDTDLIHKWRKLQTSDHFYYMCTKFWSDGDVHKFFSNYDTPHEPYVYIGNILTDLEMLIEARQPRKRAVRARAVGQPVVSTSRRQSRGTALPATPVDGLRAPGVHAAPQVRRLG
jgi:alpha-amylase